MHKCCLFYLANFPFQQTSNWCPIVPSDELKEAVIFLTSPGMIKLLEEWIFEKIFQDLNKNIRHEFWKHFENSESGSPGSESVYAAFAYLYGMIFLR